MAAVAGLIAVTADEIHLSTRYLPVVDALVVFLIGSPGIGELRGAPARPRNAVALLVTTSMRDFAIAAGLATAAFDAAAAAPWHLRDLRAV